MESRAFESTAHCKSSSGVFLYGIYPSPGADKVELSPGYTVK